jgi:hypothetical protein
MVDNTSKYFYCKDKHGMVIGYIDDRSPEQNTISVTIIACKHNKSDSWDTSERGISIMIDLRKINTEWKFYDNGEEFFSDFYEAII